jgi:outer membrane protein assembly factor BamB
LDDGAVRWSYGGPGNTAGTTDVAVAGDTVFVGSAGGWTAALNADTGAEMWVADLGEAAFGPTVSDTLVFYGTRGFQGDEPREGPLGAGHIIALDRDDGSEVWRFVLEDAPGFPNSGGSASGGAVADGLLLVAGIAGTSYGLTLSDGSLVWERENDGMPNHARHYVPPAIIGNVAVFLRNDHVIEGRSVDSGDLKWSLEHPVGADPILVRGELGYLFWGPILVLSQDGHSVWNYGGLDEMGGTSFFNADVDANGRIFSLGRGAGNNQITRVFALKPSFTP